MTTYQGPNASVTQEFVQSPGALALEDLPPTLVGTAFDVFKKENLGTLYGIIDQEALWGEDNVVFDRSVIDERSFDFYPPKAFADSLLGQIDLEPLVSDITTTGVNVGKDKDYSLPGVENTAGNSSAILPLYQKTSAQVAAGTADTNTLNALEDAGADFSLVLPGDIVLNTTDNTSCIAGTVNDTTKVITLLTFAGVAVDLFPLGTEAYLIYRPTKVLSADLRTVVIPEGKVFTAEIKPGMKVWVKTTDAPTWVNVGTVGFVGADETKVNLATPYSAAIYGYDVLIGSASQTGALAGVPEIFYDKNADFVTSRVRVGDILYFSSQGLAGSVATPKTATISAIIDNKTLRLNTSDISADLDTIDSDFTKYKAFTVATGNTLQIYSYDIKRLMGFSENYRLKDLDTNAGVPVVKVSGTQFTIPNSVGGDTVPALVAGDYFVMTSVVIPQSTEDRVVFTNMRVYKIDTITYAAPNYTITVTETINLSSNGAAVEYSNGAFLNAWTPKVTTDLVADFRAIRVEEANVVKRITSIEDIRNAWVRDGDETIDPRNELAFMAQAAFIASGSKVTFGINVDSSGSLTTEYASALEELKLVDAYSHSFGTTDGGVNALVAPYLNEQSEAYEAHERTAMIAYDTEDVFLQGTDTASVDAAGLVTLNGAFNPLTAGTTVGDFIRVIDANGAILETLNVTETPTITTQIQTDGTTVHTALSVRILKGNKNAQALSIGDLGEGLKERRVTIVWPSYFYAEFDGERMLMPPYFITATIAGLDSANVASQSFTNMPFSIPGLSNMQLDTNTIYRKLDLDEMGGGGVNVMIQDSTISQSIRSRHDLTSNMDSIEFRERSITKQADVSAKTIRSAVAPYVGRFNITNKLFMFLAQICTVATTTLVKKGVIQKISVTSITRDEVIADKINFFVEATVFVAGNYYDITLLVKSR